MLRRAPDERLPTEARRSRVRVRERASRSLCVGTCAHGQRQRTRAALRTGDPALGRRQRVSHVAECARQWRAGVQGTPPLPAPVAPELGRPGRASNNGMLANRTRERRAQRSSNRARERARPPRMLMRRRSSALYLHYTYISNHQRFTGAGATARGGRYAPHYVSSSPQLWVPGGRVCIFVAPRAIIGSAHRRLEKMFIASKCAHGHRSARKYRLPTARERVRTPEKAPSTYQRLSRTPMR